MKLAVNIEVDGKVVSANLDISLNSLVKFVTKSANGLAKRFREEGGTLDQISQEFAALSQERVAGDFMKQYLKFLAKDYVGQRELALARD